MTLFEQAVERCGLSKLLAPFTMTRLVVKAGFSPAHLTREDLMTALPVIREGLGTYLERDALERAMTDLEILAQGPEPLSQAS